jgi:hypothetical protein
MPLLQEAWNLPLGIEEPVAAAEKAGEAAKGEAGGEAPASTSDVPMTEAEADGGAAGDVQGAAAQTEAVRLANDDSATVSAVVAEAAAVAEGVAQAPGTVASGEWGAAAPSAGNGSSGVCPSGGTAAAPVSGEVAGEGGGGEEDSKVLGENRNGCNTAPPPPLAAAAAETKIVVEVHGNAAVVTST